MTRGIIGIVLLLVLLAGGMFTQWTMDKVEAPITQELTSAAQAGSRELWDTALVHQEAAMKAWRKSWYLTAALADHMPMEDIDSLFARLPVYAAQQDTTEYAAACRELARRIEAVADAHKLTWWNLM